MREGILTAIARGSRVPPALGYSSQPKKRCPHVEEKILSKLSKYGTPIERQPNRTLHELWSADEPPGAVLP
jgi:hypothetical protein